MTVQGWVAIGCAIGTCVMSILWGFGFYLLKRQVARVDNLERHFEADGMVPKLQLELRGLNNAFVSPGDLDTLTLQLAQIRNEGLSREERIVKAVGEMQSGNIRAIERLTDVSNKSVIDLRTEVGGWAGQFRDELGRVHERIDRTNDRMASQEQRRFGPA